ncbi:MAG: phosphoadenosine phosphosulfate reductase [Planctomycetes bacterium RBG_16_55_9]|nr:MAG: phosphoadenosine phosphosulfate reductase [Planctomycetes bacterium RBG_16_55_9]
MKTLKEQLAEETKGYSAEELLKLVAERFGDKIALATSFGAEDQVLTDMLYRINNKPSIFTLDTGRLPEETYQVMQTTQEKYGIRIDMLFPDYKKVEEMVNKLGPNLFYTSIEARRLCCEVRKIEPLKRKLSGLQAWICGLRAEQSVTRTNLQRIEFDENFGLIKVSPLVDWTTEQVWNYIHENKVPYNKLHDKGYSSIGCAPCTRAVRSGEDIRAGRWWWERPEHKECGLHRGRAGNKGKPETRN